VLNERRNIELQKNKISIKLKTSNLAVVSCRFTGCGYLQINREGDRGRKKTTVTENISYIFNPQ